MPFFASLTAAFRARFGIRHPRRRNRTDGRRFFAHVHLTGAGARFSPVHAVTSDGCAVASLTLDGGSGRFARASSAHGRTGVGSRVFSHESRETAAHSMTREPRMTVSARSSCAIVMRGRTISSRWGRSVAHSLEWRPKSSRSRASFAPMGALGVRKAASCLDERSSRAAPLPSLERQCRFFARVPRTLARVGSPLSGQSTTRGRSACRRLADVAADAFRRSPTSALL